MGTAWGDQPAGAQAAAPMPPTRHDVDEQRMRDRLRDALFDTPPPIVTVGRYQLLEKIGSGGLGVVYAAYDPQLDRKVALKLVQHTKLGTASAQRMQREAQAMAKLSHPNVVTVHDVGAHGQGVFIAMELIEGVTLKQWLRAKPRAWKEMRDVLIRAGEGLAAAHKRGLVHRDFKPANVLIDGDGRAVVLDFGLARIAGEGAPTPSTDPTMDPTMSSTSLLELELTRAGAVVGTPAYMAPEQFAGQVDAVADQWAFCVTAYEAFYGERPFRGSSLEELRGCIMSGRLPPIPSGSSVPGWMHKAIARGLSVSPTSRHPSIAALLAAMQRDRRSRRLLWLSVAGAAALVATTAGVTTWLVRPEPSVEARARLDELEAGARSAAEDGRFVYPPADAPDARTAWSMIAELEGLDGPITPEARARAQALRREFAERLVKIGDGYYDQAGGVPFASDFYAAALLFDPEHGRAAERSTLTPGELATLRQKADRGEFTDAELVGAEPLAALADPDESDRKKRLTKLYAKRRPAASTSLHLENLLGSDAPAIMHRSQLAAPKTAKKRSELRPDEQARGEAEASRNDEADASSQDSGRRDRKGATAEVAHAKEAAAAGRYDEAEQAFHRALGKDRRNVPALSGLSDLYFERGAYQKALKYAEQAVGIAPRKAGLRMQLGDTLFKVHRYEPARTHYEKAKKLGHRGATKALERLDERVGGG